MLAGLSAVCLAACGSESSSVSEADDRQLNDADAGSSAEGLSNEEKEEVPMQQDMLYVTAGGETFSAAFADNSGAQAFKEMLAGGDVTIRMSDYGGFEKVGDLGQSLTTENSQTTTRSGDIVLYQGNQIVIFYGSNSWSYTRLGRIDDLTGWQEALGGGDVTVTFSLQSPERQE